MNVSEAATPSGLRTPPPAKPHVKATLPTPSSFSSRRNRSQDTQESPPSAKGHSRSASFSLETASAEDEQPKYRIPQRKEGELTPSIVSPETSTRRVPIPQPLNLGPRSHSDPSTTLCKGPPTAPNPRFASAADTRSLSKSPGPTRGSRNSLIETRSIWSANPGNGNLGGWISPALNSARSTGTAARQRGLTMAVMKDDKEMLVGDMPLTPGIALNTKSPALASSAPLKSPPTEGTGRKSPAAQQDKRDVIILCRYYHTPGLTCTSRPCRFVHNLDAIKSPKPVSDYEMLSPDAKDLTCGTFAQAQLRAQTKILNVDELVTKGAAPGETVVLSSGNGHEVTGTVYLMSGGGKGPAGKSRSKFKTVPCKDYVEGFCPYGDYCSFIHDEKKPTTNIEAKETTRRHSTGMTTPKPVINAGASNLPRTIVAAECDGIGSEKTKRRLSAFAAPYSATRVHVDQHGDNVASASTASHEQQPVGASTLFQPKVASKSSSWTKTPLALKKVSIVEPEQTPLNSATHLTVPPSAISLFGTESDPATPWDPVRTRTVDPTGQDPEEHRHSTTPPSTYGSSPDRSVLWTPSYPWGMPMNPSSQLDASDPLASIPGGPGVMWTPAGWAVQDAAMKLSLKAAEVKAKTGGRTRARAKNYYKTRPCKYFAEGHCPHGEECSYRHDEPGTIRNNRPKPANAKTLPCKFFNSAMGCNNGDDCDFLHQIVVPASVPLIDKPRPWRTRPCRHWQVGRCNLGEACHFAHVVDPTRKSIDVDRPCRHWQLGRCEKGDECRFRHEGRQESQEQQLTEASLAQAYEYMRRHTIRDDSDDEDDGVEIVTVSSVSGSLAQRTRV